MVAKMKGQGQVCTYVPVVRDRLQKMTSTTTGWDAVHGAGNTANPLSPPIANSLFENRSG